MPTVLLLLTAFALALSGVRADSSHILCAKKVNGSEKFEWWNNQHLQNPCFVLQHLLRQCDPTHTIQKMPASPVHIPDVCAGKPTNTGDHLTNKQNKEFNSYLPCCCNTAAYALRQACWSCQQGRESPPSPDRRPTFREYLQCPSSVKMTDAKLEAAKVPAWALLPVDIDSTWNFTTARQFAATLVALPTDPDNSPGAPSDPDDNPSNSTGSGTSQSSKSSNSERHAMVIVAIISGIFAGLAAVAIALAIAVCVRRRRRSARLAAWARNTPFASPAAFSPARGPSADELLLSASAPLSPAPSESFASSARAREVPMISLPRPRRARAKAAAVLGLRHSNVVLNVESLAGSSIRQRTDSMPASERTWDSASATDTMTPIARMTESMFIAQPPPMPETPSFGGPRSVASTHLSF